MGKSLPNGERLKVIKAGKSYALILPDHVLAKLGVSVGDEVYLNDVPDGAELRRFESNSAAQKEVAREVMARRRKALRKLAE